jgi:acetoacetyl-CoA synthetase
MAEDPVWSPTRARIDNSNLKSFIARHAPRTQAGGYAALHRWSVAEPASFWSAVAEHCGLELSQEAECIVENFERMPGARWFQGARLNYAENLLETGVSGQALIFVNERGERRELPIVEVRHQVAAVAAALRDWGVGLGDRVAGVLPNTPECVVASLATASIGAVWSSCSPDFGSASLLDRLGQIEPKVLFGVDGYHYAGKTIDCLPKLDAAASALPSVERVIVTRYAGQKRSRKRGQTPSSLTPIPFDEIASGDAEPNYAQVPFDHPLFIMFSSGTTGPPKCIVHGAGGTLLQHLKEHQLHCDLKPGDRLFYYTTCGWMMWNWLLSALASGASLILYDGAPFHPDPGVLWRIAEREHMTAFGTSARYLGALQKSGYAPARSHSLTSLQAIFSTGSPLAPASFDFVYEQVKADLMLASIAGGTDIISCFVLGNPMLPVYRGEIQCLGLGMDVAVFDAAGQIVSQKGELVCRAPFPSMPVRFWNDPDGAAYRRAYFETFPNVWHHGDYAELTRHGGIVMHGRSDATLNPGGVRIGTAEIYRVLEQLPEIADGVAVGQERDGDTRIVLFVQLTGGALLDPAIETRIKQAIRTGASPHHVPARIVQVSGIPRTLNGKISERAVNDAIHGRAIANLAALANPDVLDEFRARPELDS